MTEQVELQCCEHCGKEFPLETMRSMDDCWFCAGCTADFQKHFDACDHEWSSDIDAMGDTGQYCQKCSGFVRDDDFDDLFGAPSVSRPPSGDAT